MRRSTQDDLGLAHSDKQYAILSGLKAATRCIHYTLKSRWAKGSHGALQAWQSAPPVNLSQMPCIPPVKALPKRDKQQLVVEKILSSRLRSAFYVPRKNFFSSLLLNYKYGRNLCEQGTRPINVRYRGLYPIPSGSRVGEDLPLPSGIQPLYGDHTYVQHQ